MTKYFVQDAKKYSTTNFDSLKEAKQSFDSLCEEFPNSQFKIIRRITTEEVVCASEDVRQARFDFTE
jgi:predicted 3-demethylubiquinone-9 3-methyltransferase (glyoxalase superfamily)